MKKEEVISVYHRARLMWGMHSQMIAAIEEFSELNVELAKLATGKRNEQKEDDRKKLIDELADASIMLEQMVYNFELKKEVEARRFEKIKRLDGILNSTAKFV